MADVDRCFVCNEPVPEGMQVCPTCMRKAGVSEETVSAADELRDIADVLKITAPTDANIRVALDGILRIAERLEGKRK